MNVVFAGKLNLYFCDYLWPVNFAMNISGNQDELPPL